MRLRLLAWSPFLPALAVFGWQFVLGCLIGREAGWMLYIPAGLLPLAILGWPCFGWATRSASSSLTMNARTPAAVWPAERFVAISCRVPGINGRSTSIPE